MILYLGLAWDQSYRIRSQSDVWEKSTYDYALTVSTSDTDVIHNAALMPEADLKHSISQYTAASKVLARSDASTP